MRTKSNKGFTLLEVIISIAALSFISIFILQMFISAQELNSRAKDADTAISEAITALDSFKKNRSLDDYLAKCAYVATEDSNTATILNYYDRNWSSTDIEANAHYRLEVNISADEEITTTEMKDVEYGRLYVVEVEVTENTSGEWDRTLASLRTKKYFSTKGVADTVSI